jgi:hypothetical protein
MEDASLKYFVGQLTSPIVKAVPENLREHLVVEHEVVGIF